MADPRILAEWIRDTVVPELAQIGRLRTGPGWAT